MERELNRQQRLFCYEYLIDFNAKAAAERAGYSKRSSETLGLELLRKTHVKQHIESIQKARESISKVKAEHVEDEIRKIAMMNPEDFVMAYGKGFIMTINHKLKALEMLCRIKGMFNDKLELTFKGMTREQIKNMLQEWVKANEQRARETAGPGVSEAPRLLSSGEEL